MDRCVGHRLQAHVQRSVYGSRKAFPRRYDMTSLLPNDAHMNYVLSLRDIPQRQVGHAGAKAAKLRELARAGFPVPAGFVLTTSPCDRCMSANALGPAS